MKLRIKEIASQQGKKLYEIADAIGMDQGGFSRMVSGSRRANTEMLTKTAKYLGVPVSALFEAPKIPVVGYVGAGGEVLAVDDFAKGDGFDHIEPEGYYSPSAVAVIVRGDSMYDKYQDGDTLVYDERRGDLENFVGRRECIVGLADGRIMVKKLTRGSAEGFYTLTSSNYPPIEDVVVEWCARIRSVKYRED
ncbi:MAG: LexA family transcriptional regulator [Pseudomonadota bacterium]